jgi:non-ribosomal peptide synthetase component F
MITHGAISNHMQWSQQTYPLQVEDALLQKTSFGFDASVWEFYAPLIAGARLVLARPGGHQDSQYLVEALGVSIQFVKSATYHYKFRRWLRLQRA